MAGAGAKSALVVLGSALVAHVFAGGSLPSPLRLLWMFGLSTCVCTAVVATLRQRRIRSRKAALTRIGASLVAAQLAVHAALGPSHHDHLTAVGHPSGTPLAPLDGFASGVPPMVLAHGVAGLVAAGLLAYGARLLTAVRAWTSSGWQWLVRPEFSPVPRLPRARPDSCTREIASPALLGRDLSRRAPPVLATAGC